MTIMKKFFLIPLIALFASCKLTQTSTLSTPMYAPKADINPIHADVDIDINKKLQGEAQASYFLIFRLGGDKSFAEGLSFSGSPVYPTKYRMLKAAAAYKAVENSGADMIVHPNYIIEERNFFFFKNVRMKVSGYSGKFKKFYQCPVNCDKREACKCDSNH
jgi:hypothetical protein